MFAAVAAVAVSAAGPAAGQAAFIAFHAETQWLPTVTPPDQPKPGLLASTTTLVDDPVGHGLYAVSRDGNNGWLAAYDTRTLQPLGGGLTTDQFTAAIPDLAGGRLLAAAQTAGGIPNLEVFTPGVPGITQVASAPLTGLSGLSVIGMYQQSASDLYLLAATYDTALFTTYKFVPGSVVIAKIDLNSLTRSAVNVSWTNAVPSCQLPVAYTFQPGMYTLIPAAGIGYVAATHSLYFGCNVQSAGLGLQRSPLPAGAGRLSLPDDGSAPTPGSFNLFAHPGNFGYGDSFFDRPSGRLIITAGKTAYAFDGTANAYVGSIDLGVDPTPQGSGMNARTGQLYAFTSHDGLVAAFIRLTPVGQAFFDTDLIPKPAPPEATLTIDPDTNRVFILESSPSADNTQYFLVVHYDGETLTQPAPGQPDSNTNDLAEQQGLTARTYSGSAQGYGTLVRWAGGSDAAISDAANFDTGGTGPFGPGTREMRLAYLNQISLSLSQASASSVPMDRDVSNSGQDQASLCAAPYQAPTGSAPPSQWNSSVCTWPSPTAACSNFGGTAQQDSAGNNLGTATATCDVQGQAAAAVASSNAALAGGVSVGSTSVTSSIGVDPTKGLVTTVTSVARNVDVDNGALTIGEVQLTATSQAHGRPGTARSTFTPVFHDVAVQGGDLCTTDCDPHTLAAQINAQLAGLVHVDFPSPDKDLLGSPGGYQALIRRPLADQIQDGDVNDQPADRTEVPAMVITAITEDNQKPSRVVTYLAGAEVEARYGIYPLGTMVPQPPFDQGSLLSGGAGASGFSVGSPAGSSLQAIQGNSASSRGTSGPLGQVRSALGGLLPPGGWRWIAEHPLQALRLLFMWMVLLTPVYLAARRWLLIQRNRVLQEALR